MTIKRYPHKMTASNEYVSVKISDLDGLERKLKIAKEGLSEIVEVAADDPYEAYRIAENILSEIEK